MKTEPNEPINGAFIIGKDRFSVPNAIPKNNGLTKREHFAALAMASYYGGEFTGQSGMPFEIIAENCVKMADALIAQLNKDQI